MEFLLFFSSTVSPLLFFSCAASSTLIGAMAESLVGPITKKLTEKLIDVGFKYLKDQVRWQTGMKEELQRLQENHDKIRAVVSAAIKAQKIDQNREINNWIWRLRDAFDEADDLLDDFEYMKHEEPLTRDKARSTMSRIKKIGKRVIKSDRILKRLEVVVHKLDQISAEVNIFCDLLRDTQQEQKVQQDRLQNVRETGFFYMHATLFRSNNTLGTLNFNITPISPSNPPPLSPSNPDKTNMPPTPFAHYARLASARFSPILCHQRRRSTPPATTPADEFVFSDIYKATILQVFEHDISSWMKIGPS